MITVIHMAYQNVNVDKVNTTNPMTYYLKDLRNEKILGSFYHQELARAKHKNI